jgi:SAM-dependent methyltransferase
MSDAAAVSDPAFWEDLYARRSDRWELGGPTPPLVEYLHKHPPPPAGPEGMKVVVPGCGRGHDARLLARRGYRVWAFDFAEPAIREARALAAGLDVRFEQRDVFGLADDYRGFFDGVWEYTSFCAIDPARRPEYVALVRELLRPGGWLLACFFPIGSGSAGPPFPATTAEIRALFSPAFTIVEDSVPTSSAPGRQGREWLVFARRADP